VTAKVLVQNMSYDVWIVKIGLPFFAQVTPQSSPNSSPSPPNPMLYNAFQSDRYSKSAPSHGSFTSHVIHVPLTCLTQHPKLHLKWFSHFCTAHDRDTVYFTKCTKMQLMQFEKLLAAVNAI